ncbi:hypothetical protein I6Y99_004414 [Vibrio parahaemolyticus]|nr:hypothetical protein [Vibrio parahaemolyticus]
MNYKLMNRIRVTNRPEHFAVLPTDEQFQELYSGELGDLMCESVSIDDIDATYHYGMPVVHSMFLEAIQTTTSRIDMTMKAFARAFNQQSQGSGITVTDIEVGKPRKSGAIAIVTARMTLSDGQAISVVFHNPDETPDKVNPGDTLVAFRFMLNGRDVTHVVAPNGGKDISLKQSTMALANVAERNTAKFQEAKARNAELQAQIDADESEAERLEEEIAQVSLDIETADTKLANAQKTADNLTRKISEQNEYQEDLKNEIESFKQMNPQVAKFWYGMRSRPFDIASQPPGHSAYLQPQQAAKRFPSASSRDIRYGAVGYQQPLSEQDIDHYSMTDLNKPVESMSESNARGLSALDLAIDDYMTNRELDSLPQSTVDSLMQVYDSTNGDGLNKLQSIFAKELREQPEYVGRIDNPDLYQQWLDGLRSVTREQLESSLDKRIGMEAPTATSFDSEVEQIAQLSDALNAGKISLKAAKERFTQIVSNLPESLRQEASDVQLANRKSRYIEYLKSFSDRLNEYDPQAPVVTTDAGTIDFNEMTYDAVDQHAVFGKTLAQVAKVNPQAVIDYLKDADEWTSIDKELLKTAAEKAEQHYLPPTEGEDPNIGREWDSVEGKAVITGKEESGEGETSYIVEREVAGEADVITTIPAATLEDVIKSEQKAWEDAQSEPDVVPEPPAEPEAPEGEEPPEPTQEQAFVEQLQAIRDGEFSDVDQAIQIMEDAYNYFEANDLVDEHMALLDAAMEANTEAMDQEGE